eukprot:c28997_g1_i1 orf=1-213(-)
MAISMAMAIECSYISLQKGMGKTEGFLCTSPQKGRSDGVKKLLREGVNNPQWSYASEKSRESSDCEGALSA